jgi:hypothetical protein
MYLCLTVFMYIYMCVYIHMTPPCLPDHRLWWPQAEAERTLVVLGRKNHQEIFRLGATRGLQMQKVHRMVRPPKSIAGWNWCYIHFGYGWNCWCQKREPGNTDPNPYGKSSISLFWQIIFVDYSCGSPMAHFCKDPVFCSVPDFVQAAEWYGFSWI